MYLVDNGTERQFCVLEGGDQMMPMLPQHFPTLPSCFSTLLSNTSNISSSSSNSISHKRRSNNINDSISQQQQATVENTTPRRRAKAEN